MLVAALVAAAGVAAFTLFGKHTPPAEAKSIAVLPLVNMSSDREQEYFSDGLSEELLDALVKIPTSRWRDERRRFRSRERTRISRHGQKLGVAPHPGRQRAQVGQHASHHRAACQRVRRIHVWSQTYDRTLDDILRAETTSRKRSHRSSR
jgi:TolB-like protein